SSDAASARPRRCSPRGCPRAEMAYRVLLTDPLGPEGLAHLRQHSELEVVARTELGPGELRQAIRGFHALIVRSRTKVTAENLAGADVLRVIGRAGIGVDNIDVDAATKRGVVVMNTPGGSNVTTAEHAIAILLPLARHTPLTPETRGLIGAATIARMKRGVRLVNCARGGIVDEPALAAAIRSGQVAGAALDVFAEEPPPSGHPLLALEQVIATPHLGASTGEAQVNVAIAIAQQVADFLCRGVIQNAVNAPSLSPEVVQVLRPYLLLAEKLG